MRLAFCIFKYFPFGGIQRDLLKMVRECLARGHAVRILTTQWLDAAPPEDVQISLAPVRAMTNHRLYERFAEWVADDLARHPVDLVVGLNKMPGLDVYYAGDSCYQDKALTQRRFWHRLLPRHHSFLRAERAVFRAGATTEILTISAAQAPMFRRYYHTEPHRFHPLPPGIERDRVAPSDRDAVRRGVRAKLGLNESQNLLLFVGSGFVKKGLDRLIKGLQALPPAVRTQTQLYVLGEDNAGPFKRMAARLDVGKQVHFMGGRRDVADFLFAADGFVLPAYDENTGGAILEAVAAGTPALVTENCGYASYVEQAEAGLVAPSPFDQRIFNDQLLELFTSNKRHQWADNGLAFAEKEVLYGMAATAVDLFDLFYAARTKNKAQSAAPTRRQ